MGVATAIGGNQGNENETNICLCHHRNDDCNRCKCVGDVGTETDGAN